MSHSSPAITPQPSTVARLALCILPLAWLWWVLIDHLRVEWSLNAQYGYGFAVPFLCALLLWRRFQKAENKKRKIENGKTDALASRAPISAFRPFSFRLLIVFLALLYLPTRLIQEANPDWRLVSWALALEVVGITLALIHFSISAFQFFRFHFSNWFLSRRRAVANGAGKFSHPIAHAL